MFKRLKEKLAGAISKISERIKKAEPKEETEEDKQVAGKIEDKKLVEEKLVEEKEEVQKPEPEKKGIFKKIRESVTTTTISEKQYEDMFSSLEMALLENNVAVEVVDKIKVDLKESVVNKKVKRKEFEKLVESSLRNSITKLFENSLDLLEEIKKSSKPYVVVFFGMNGSGKTTTIAKIAKLLKDNKLSCVIAAADTFRAASIEQLQIHGNKLDVRVIKHNYGSDPAAVAFDAIKHAESKNLDVVLIDTAGRTHANKNLMLEMEKIVRVAKPDFKMFVGESITGNDAVEQAKSFNDAVGIDGIILSKLDVDEKGGAVVSVSYVTKKPILYFGVGQKYDDLREFDSGIVVGSLGLG